MAEEEGARIIQRAHEEAAQTQRGADEYAANVLVGLESELVRTLQSVRKGVEMLDARGGVNHGPVADEAFVDGFGEDEQEAEAEHAAAGRW